LFPKTKKVKWKWLAEAFPPKVSQYLFDKYVEGSNLVLLDLFTGIGGWGLGAVWSGKFQRIIMIEKDLEKCIYLKLNFNKIGIDYEIICRDVRNVDYSKLVRVDVITASPPCEDLSMLRFLNKYKIKVVRGTIPLTVFVVELVEKIKPKIAFYENVYRRTLRELLEKHGWSCTRFDMSNIIPQKRIRLICIKKFG